MLSLLVGSYDLVKLGMGNLQRRSNRLRKEGIMPKDNVMKDTGRFISAILEHWVLRAALLLLGCWSFCLQPSADSSPRNLLPNSDMTISVLHSVKCVRDTQAEQGSSLTIYAVRPHLGSKSIPFTFTDDGTMI